MEIFLHAMFTTLLAGPHREIHRAALAPARASARSPDPLRESPAAGPQTCPSTRLPSRLHTCVMFPGYL